MRNVIHVTSAIKVAAGRLQLLSMEFQEFHGRNWLAGSLPKILIINRKRISSLIISARGYLKQS
jgi:hypothetical protein